MIHVFQVKNFFQIVPLIRASKTIASLGINLTQDVQNLYAESHKTLMREKSYSIQIYLWIRRHNIVNMSFLPKLIYRTKNQSQSKSQHTVFFLTDKFILNFIKKMQNSRIAKITLTKKKLEDLL